MGQWRALSSTQASVGGTQYRTRHPSRPPHGPGSVLPAWHWGIAHRPCDQPRDSRPRCQRIPGPGPRALGSPLSSQQAWGRNTVSRGRVWTGPLSASSASPPGPRGPAAQPLEVASSFFSAPAPLHLPRFPAALGTFPKLHSLSFLTCKMGMTRIMGTAQDTPDPQEVLSKY